ncbi:MAG: serine/threonine-protein kinase, partial [Nannocystaceae bacterium]
VVGTPLYIPPEAVDGASPNPKFDVYALGVTLYQLLSGKRPYPGKVSLELLKARALADPMPIRRVAPQLGITVAAEAVVMQALARDPEQRYASASEFADAIRQSLTSQETQVGVSRHQVMGGPPSAQMPTVESTPLDRNMPTPSGTSGLRTWNPPSKSSGSISRVSSSAGNAILDSGDGRITPLGTPLPEKSPTATSHRRALIVGALIALACVSAVLLALALYSRMNAPPPPT